MQESGRKWEEILDKVEIFLEWFIFIVSMGLAFFMKRILPVDYLVRFLGCVRNLWNIKNARVRSKWEEILDKVRFF